MPLPLLEKNFTREEFKLFLESKTTDIIVKFEATWCGPCQRIKGVFDKWHEYSSNSIQFLIIDVDESFDLYAYFKKNKITPGIPALLYYKQENREIFPTDVLIGADNDKVESFFCKII